MTIRLEDARDLCERLTRQGLDLPVLLSTLESGARSWVDFVSRTLAVSDDEALRFLARLRIESVQSEADLKERVLEKLGAVYEEPVTAYARLREFLRENLDSAGAITWPLLEGCAGTGPRITPTQQLLRDGLEPLESAPRPVDLLRAGIRALRFSGRAEELQELEQWWQGDAPVSLLLFTGPGGSGKTRLLIEWCRELREQRGETAGFLPRLVSPEQLRQLALRRERRVVVVDYAETRTRAVEELLQWAVEQPQARGRLRIVLLARREGDWWASLGKLSFSVQRIVKRQGRIWDLGPLASDKAARRELFAAALTRFGEILQVKAPEPIKVDLSPEHFAHPLFLQMAVLSTLQGGTTSQEGDLLTETLEHEVRYWGQAVTALGLTPPDHKVVERALSEMIALATLWGGIFWL